MRINKYIGESGKASRRGADRLVNEGRVTINGELAALGSVVQAGDDVRIDDQPVYVETEKVYMALNKPVGITSTTDSDIAGNIVDLMNHPLRVFHIGRLDKDSEGLILMTNDGDIVNPILRSEHQHEKEYIVSVDKPIKRDFLRRMSAGVEILDTTTLPCKVTQLSKFDFKIILTQGLNRQIRRMTAALGYKVVHLQRIRIMNIHLGDLPHGKWRNLTKQELIDLFEELNYHP
ncbi:pseudouridine synthase [Fundicoccus sp. Sow4_D5]|uniref:pseudouridine synthase n=1 Tax=unclassified Fundicoccus TaxID=2761543 RepID=UPI003F914B42